ncbi:unnamed protein product [Citrullus colocynthis]|uniref:Uncharacterized protein n=1 Tax=Citrullus colocynthis TaxID=252529 RepID=A0ABP0Z6M9_9ROSI
MAARSLPSGISTAAPFLFLSSGPPHPHNRLPSYSIPSEQRLSARPPHNIPKPFSDFTFHNLALQNFPESLTFMPNVFRSTLSVMTVTGFSGHSALLAVVG